MHSNTVIDVSCNRLRRKRAAEDKKASDEDHADGVEGADNVHALAEDVHRLEEVLVAIQFALLLRGINYFDQINYADYDNDGFGDVYLGVQKSSEYD